MIDRNPIKPAHFPPKRSIMKLQHALLFGLAFAGANAMACYTVYDGSNRVVYQGERAPVDMTVPLHETVGRQFPGATLVFSQGAACTPVPMAQVARTAVPPVATNSIRFEGSGRQVPVRNGPLLTDRRTATSLNLPYTAMAGEIVLVPADVAARVNYSALTTVRRTETEARAPTSVMGAGPARGETVITELHNPPLTGVQRGESLAITRR